MPESGLTGSESTAAICLKNITSYTLDGRLFYLARCGLIYTDVVGGFAFDFGRIVWLAISWTVGICVDKAEDMPSLDQAAHGIEAYAKLGKISEKFRAGRRDPNHLRAAIPGVVGDKSCTPISGVKPR